MFCCGATMVSGAPVFGRVLVLDWEDGPVSGFIECGNCKNTYEFRTVAHDDAYDRRVMALSPVPNSGLNKLIDVLARYLEPRWPTWVPIWAFPSAEAHDEVEAELSRFVKQVRPIAWIVITKTLSAGVDGALRVTNRNRATIEAMLQDRAEYDRWAQLFEEGS